MAGKRAITLSDAGSTRDRMIAQDLARKPETPRAAVLPRPGILSKLVRINGALVAFSSLGVAILGWVVFALLAENLRKNPDFRDDIAASALMLIDRRAWWPLLATPALAAGMVLALKKKSMGPGGRMVLAGLAYLWLFMLFGAVLWTFVRFMQPLYEYKPL